MVARHKVEDLAFSLLIVAFGIYIVASGAQLPFGSMRRIGPGFFPVVLGVVMTAFGIASLFDRPTLTAREPFNVFGLLFVSLAILSFALLVETVGLFPAVTAVVLLTSLAGRQRLSLPTVLATIVGLCAAGYLIFISALQLPLEPFILPGW